MAAFTVSPINSQSGLLATAFYTGTKDSIVIVEPLRNQLFIGSGGRSQCRIHCRSRNSVFAECGKCQDQNTGFKAHCNYRWL